VTTPLGELEDRADNQSDSSPEVAAVTLDGVSYSLDQLSDVARQNLASIRYCEEMIRQRNNELAIADTARLAYTGALKRELAKNAADID